MRRLFIEAQLTTSYSARIDVMAAARLTGQREPRGQVRTDAATLRGQARRLGAANRACMRSRCSHDLHWSCLGPIRGESATRSRLFFLSLSASWDADSSWRRGITRCAAGAYCCCRVLCGSLHALLDMRRHGRGVFELVGSWPSKPDRGIGGG